MLANVSDMELKALAEISRIFGQALDLDRALEQILSFLAEHMAMARATVILEDPENGKLAIRASHGLSDEEKRRGVYGAGEGITGTIFKSGEPVFVPDIGNEPLFLNKTRSRPRDRDGISFLGVPIRLGGRTVGVVTVDRLSGGAATAQEDLTFLTVLAQLIGQFVGLNREVAGREEALKRRARTLQAEMAEYYNNFFIVGKSPAMERLQRLVGKVAPSRASVLLLGESGTGKTLVARVIHNLSPRKDAPFVKINCAALPENLLESELFGHEKGAFTGATQAKRGRVEEAHGGTLFLDEVGELPLALQAKLLRFLQDREFERLGGNKTFEVDVRIVAATNADLSRSVENGAFREDLYYRLNVFPIQISPLRERKEDIPLLLNHFLDKFSREYARTLTMDNQAIHVFENYRWPGNVREMENVVEQLAIMAEEPHLGVNALPGHLFQNPGGENSDETPDSRLDGMVKREMLSALERAGWVQSRAAKELGLTLRQFSYRLEKFGLTEMVRANRRRATAG